MNVSAARLALMVLGLWILGAGMLCAIGPGDRLHHELHKRGIGPFKPCCCRNADHTVCAWGDHFGGPWRAHHPRIARLGLPMIGCGVTALAACWLAGRAGRNGKVA